MLKYTIEAILRDTHLQLPPNWTEFLVVFGPKWTERSDFLTKVKKLLEELRKDGKSASFRYEQEHNTAYVEVKR